MTARDIYIPLSRGLVTVISGADADLVLGMKWHARPGPPGFVYAVHCYWEEKKVKTVRLHRLIVGAPDGALVDHADGNTLNNRRENLRICGPAENSRNAVLSSANTVGLKGVYIHSPGVYRARIFLDGKKISLGLFRSADAAARAYDAAALRLFGEFAKTNEAMGLLGAAA